MDYIVKYLKDPIKVGVYTCKVRIDLKTYEKFFASIIERCHRRSQRTRIKGYLKIAGIFSFRSLLTKISYALNELTEMEKCPKKISSFFEECELGGREESLYEEIFGEEYPIEIFEPLILAEYDDVLSNDVVSHSEEKLKIAMFIDSEDLEPLIVEMSSIKDRGVKLYLNFLKSIPYIGKKTQVIRAPQKTFSSRYSFQPYALAVRLWLKKNGKTTIPKDLQAFIDRASIYHISKEWRTSIVLSAITVESLLADLYEESYQKPSPEKATLGELYEHVKKKVDFPSHIADSIVKTNNARIAAVHRSRLTVSEREATNALFGAVNLGMWYTSDYTK